ncbi:helix-turn-helix domain-containing protein [Streptomyces yunnanensis]|uniref:Helix-turn-helix domain-containing protein n=1 Tax=Streptomyces yunnanensis TaxID=156453 RepID=A0A9X8QQW9_9ACTN|nr:helix-turn-helix domain-containing protein [Streptomyces yunnanensis]SHL43849.1 Helix-turn-helix domain-containing protein [Streptomyces yunnanensis]
MDPLELLGHPVRLRIVHLMRGGQLLTATQLCARIRDVSQATVYRHLELLATGGVLEVADERRVRGAVERRYRLCQERAAITPETAARLTTDDHRRAFAMAMTVLLTEFNAYLDQDRAAPVEDLVGYRQHSVWLSDDELRSLIGELRRVIAPRLANGPTPDRSQHLLSPILFPIAEPPAGSE